MIGRTQQLTGAPVHASPSIESLASPDGGAKDHRGEQHIRSYTAESIEQDMSKSLENVRGPKMKDLSSVTSSFRPEKTKDYDELGNAANGRRGKPAKKSR